MENEQWNQNVNLRFLLIDPMSIDEGETRRLVS